MSDDLTLLEDWAAGLLAAVAPAGRRKLARSIATALRRSQAERIKAQRNPDGTAFVPRKARKDLRGKAGRVKRQAMFAKLRTAKWLRTRATPGKAEVGFSGRVTAIAEVHQYGEVGPVSPAGPRVRYPRRELLGFSDSDRVAIRKMVVEILARPQP